MTLQQRLGLRLLNRCGSGLRRMGWSGADIDPDRLEQEARRHTGLTDFGSNRYREPLEKLCQSYAQDDEQTFFGRLVCRGTLLHLLENRLRIQRDLTQHPEILQQPVSRPLFVIGLPRTGTTLLFNLLAQDPTARPLLFWESMSPSPPPTPDTRTTDPRIRKARSTCRQLHRALPDLAGIHEFHPDGPEECLGLLMNVFLTPFFRGKVPLYREWLDNVSDADVDAAYREYRSQLQLLQWKVSGHHWLLKCPSHLWGLGGLLHAFPDACVVQCHRELEHSVPSLCSLTATVEQLCYETVDPKAVGQRVLHFTEQLVRRSLRARDENPNAAIHDVKYRDVTSAPLETVKAIYERFGLPYTPEFEKRLQTFLQADRHGQQRRHSYSLEQFGLTPSDLQGRFHDYVERIGL